MVPGKSKINLRLIIQATCGYFAWDVLGFGLNEFLLEDEMVMAADPAEILHTLQDPKPWKILQSLARTQMGHLP